MRVCSGKGQYFIIGVLWVMSFLFYLSAMYEKNVSFVPGRGLEQGYICYTNETNTNITVWFTNEQFTVSLSNDIMIFLIIAISYLTIWITFKKEVKNKNENLPYDELSRLRVNLKAQLLEKRMIFTIGIICSYYVILRFPIFFIGRSHISKITFWSGFCIILHQIQFCFHFVIYAIIHESYRHAYFDILKISMPCCFLKKTKTEFVPAEKRKRKLSQITKAVRFSMEEL